MRPSPDTPHPDDVPRPPRPSPRHPQPGPDDSPHADDVPYDPDDATPDSTHDPDDSTPDSTHDPDDSTHDPDDATHDPVLMALVMAVDDELSTLAVDGALLRVSDLMPAHESFMWTPLDGAHPLELLLGFRAPLHWRALGVSCPGRSHALDDDGGRARLAGEGDPVTVTLLVDRRGASASVVRSGPTVTPMPGRTDGAVADACRRALDLPTAPPPPSTIGLWTLAWLDRVVDTASRADASRRLRTWPQVAELHPAVGPLAGSTSGMAGPAPLAQAARALAQAWPWARLREHAGAGETPGHPPSPQLSAWMDEGMWARWLLSRLPAADDLMAAVQALLPPRLGDDVAMVARAGLSPA